MINGFLLVNKPGGITSFDVIRRLRKITGVRKIGHAGTLDPLASGLMLVLFGDACKRAGEFSQLDKIYQAEVTLGANSSTGDGEGELTRVDSRQKIVDREEIEAVLRSFVGRIQQTPPIYSAVKVRGKEAYKYARRGQAIQVPPRLVTISELRTTNYAYPKLELEAKVSSGTYIRSLAQDIGEKLGTGAYLSGLVRTEIGDFALDRAIELENASLGSVRQRLQTTTRLSSD